jgi:hypothetical protein
MTLPDEIHAGGRRLLTRVDPYHDKIRVFDVDYGIELDAIDGKALRGPAHDARAAVAKACREPTSLEILYYAQVGGPHVKAAP